MNFDDYNFNELKELKILIENGYFNNVSLDDVNVLSALHECLIESNNLSNILNTLINSIKNINIEPDNIESLNTYVYNFKNDLQDILEYQNSFFNDINKLFFNNN